MAHRKPDELFLKGMKAVSAIYLGVVEEQEREIQALRLMLIEGHVAEETIDEEVARRVEDPVVQALAKQFMEEEHIDGLQETIAELLLSPHWPELLNQLREPSN